jgi:hypothetical protein
MGLKSKLTVRQDARRLERERSHASSASPPSPAGRVTSNGAASSPLSPAAHRQSASDHRRASPRPLNLAAVPSAGMAAGSQPQPRTPARNSPGSAAWTRPDWGSVTGSDGRASGAELLSPASLSRLSEEAGDGRGERAVERCLVTCAALCAAFWGPSTSKTTCSPKSSPRTPTPNL